jgi:methylated-DNA-[protein]-cysteine S-methyltransferase
MIKSLCMDTPLGRVVIQTENQAIVALDFVKKSAVAATDKDAVLQQAQTQLRAYWAAAQAGFNLPLAPVGTDFQKRVWQALCEIPVGEVRTYGELARQLKSSPRAVGGACRANPIPIIIPCHRVVSRQGLGGYSGQTTGANMDIKKALLRHEGLEIRD